MASYFTGYYYVHNDNDIIDISDADTAYADYFCGEDQNDIWCGDQDWQEFDGKGKSMYNTIILQLGMWMQAFLEFIFGHGLSSSK